jgi:hypothetical protein
MELISTKSWDDLIVPRTMFFNIETDLRTIKLILFWIIISAGLCHIEPTVSRFIKLIEIFNRNFVPDRTSRSQLEAILVETGVLWNSFTTHLSVIDMVRSFFNLFINCS